MIVSAALGLGLAACHQTSTAATAAPESAEAMPTDPHRPRFALALHGGAGVIARDTPEERRKAYLNGLQAALTRGRDLLAAGRPSLSVVEEVVVLLEDNPLFNAGKGAVFNAEGTHELDAAIMDGRTLAAGAVAGVRYVKNPIRLARRVMTDTPHVLLAGPGADAFADRSGFERVEPSYFGTPHRRAQWQRHQRPSESNLEAEKTGDTGTVGAVALDVHGHLAAATSTGGMTGKRFGRVGDSPVIGAGTYAQNGVCAVSATGRGEQFMRHVVAYDVCARVRHGPQTLAQAVRAVVHTELQPGDGGVIAIDGNGAIVLDFNSQGMFRGAADSTGRFEVAIW